MRTLSVIVLGRPKYGPELAVNGGLDTGDLTGFATLGGATNSVTTAATEGIAQGLSSGNIIKTVSNGAASGVSISVPTVVGARYRFLADAYGVVASSQVGFVGTTEGGGQIIVTTNFWPNSFQTWVRATHESLDGVFFTATATTTYIGMCASQVAGRTAYFDNVSVKRVF